MNYSVLYDEKVSRLKAAANHEKVDHVPVVSMAQTWAIAYAGTTAKEALSSVEREFEVYAKYLRDIYFDGTLLFAMNRPLPMHESLGYSPFFFSKDGITIQHRDNCLLPPDEIEEYTKDPILYLRNKALYRRYPKLQRRTSIGRLMALLGALRLMKAYMDKMGSVPGYLREHVGVPVVTTGGVEPALDRYICYRTFADGMSDLRRRPQLVLDALEATYSALTAPPPLPMSDFPWVFFPAVTATYLGRNTFEKFFWPTAKRAMEQIISQGGKVCIALEGSWGHVYDYLLDFPKGSVVALIEGDDMIQAKKDIGDKVALCGGLSTELLRDGTKKENIDAVRRILGECGTEGIMIAPAKALLSPWDVSTENLIATSEFVRDYRP